MPSRLADAFTRHPREAGQTYWQHLTFALYVAGQSLAAGAAAVVHALLPFLLQHSAGRRIRDLAERIGELKHRVIPFRRNTPEGASDSNFQVLRNPFPSRSDHGSCFEELLGEQSLWSASSERRVAREHLEHDTAKAVEVTASVYRWICRRLFRTHVLRCPDCETEISQPITCGKCKRLGDAKVCNNCVSGLEKNILRFDVTVNDAPPMSKAEGIGNLRCDLKNIVDGELPFSLDAMAKSFAVDVRHHIKQEAVCLTRIKKGKDVRMRKAGDRSNFSKESLCSDRRSELRAQDLQSEMSGMARFFRKVHRSHAPAAEDTLQLVAMLEGSLKTIELQLFCSHCAPWSRLDRLSSSNTMAGVNGLCK